MIDRTKLTRRTLLRSAFVGGTGLFAASLVGCGDDGGPAGGTPSTTATPDATPFPEATPTPGEGGPSATPEPSGELRWEPVPATGSLPAARRDHSLVTDGESLYVFGGRGGGQDFGDLWRFDLASGAWTELPSAGAPPVRFGHNAAYLEASREIIVFGGQTGTSFYADTWAYDIDSAEWMERTPGPAPAARYGAASALDPGSGLIVSHGFTNMGRFDDTWVYSSNGASWSDASPSGQRPIERCLTRGIWDSGNGRFLMFGGQANTAPFLGDLWALQGGAWTEITQAASPSARNFYAMTEIDLDQAVLFGGRTEEGNANDLWFYSMIDDSWAERVLETEAPSPRAGHDAAWVLSDRGFYVFGGEDDSGVLNDLWRLSVNAGPVA